MLSAKLIVIQPGHASREVFLDGGPVTIGRALDNSISLEDDSHVSLYHAEIEERAGGFWVADLGSRNGTTVNDLAVDFEHLLRDGDLIGVGGTTVIEFHLNHTRWTSQVSARSVEATDARPLASVSERTSAIVPETSAVHDLEDSAAQSASVASVSSSLSPLLLIGAICGGLLLTSAVAGIFFISNPGGCKASVRIVSPQSGASIIGSVAIRVEAEGKTDCIDRVIYELDGDKVASSEIAPYQVTLDPARLSGLTAGNHILRVAVEDAEGNRAVQAEEVLLGFETAQVPNSDSYRSTGSPSLTAVQPSLELSESLSAADIKDMCEKLAREASPKEGYILDGELLNQVKARTQEYVVAGFHSRARPFRDVINDSFINELGLDPPIAYLVAMSRSNFTISPSRSDPNSKGEGLWRIPSTLAESTGYIGRCGTAKLTDQNQKCSAIVAAVYTKSLVVDLFKGDTFYAVACFGMTLKDAAQWRDQLPIDRRDLWRAINSPEQREQLTLFFAAGIVGENPQRFGLMTDRPLSSLYPKN